MAVQVWRFEPGASKGKNRGYLVFVTEPEGYRNNRIQIALDEIKEKFLW